MNSTTSKMLDLAFSAGCQSGFRIILKRLETIKVTRRNHEIDKLMQELEDAQQIVWSHQKLDELKELILKTENLHESSTS